MKKTYILAAFAALSMSLSAQQVCTMNFEALEISGSTDIPAGMLLCEDDNAAMYAAFVDNAKPQAIKAGGYSNFAINGGEELGLGSGLGGSANPTFSYYEDGAPTAGWVFKLKAKKDGYITVFTKLSPNKQYLVMEGLTGSLPYTLGFAINGQGYIYTQPELTDGDDAGLIDFNNNPDQKYFVAGQVQAKDAAGVPLWVNKNDANDVVAAAEQPDGYSKKMEDVPGTHKPQFPYITVGLESNPGNAAGFIQFNVIEDNDYYICALGSKIILPGFVYTESGKPSVTFTGDQETVTLSADPSAVENITIDNSVLDENAPIYNTQGVRVGADAKGILIQNGKKFVRF